jgi:large subunit ribosomal protein L31e
MGTEKVLIKPSLNIGLWGKGIRNVPHKLRVRITRRQDDSEESSEKFISEVDFVPVNTFKGLATEKEA